MVDLEAMTEEDEELVRGMLESHRTFTGSSVATRILEIWEQSHDLFVKVMPRDFKRVLREREALEQGAEFIENADAAAGKSKKPVPKGPVTKSK
jgi:glutamate synthase domain-containing protein 3